MQQLPAEPGARRGTRALREDARRRERLERDAASQREYEARPRQAPAGRTCAELGCATVLSRYNPGERCRMHSAKPHDPDARPQGRAASRRRAAEARRILAP